MTPLTVAERSSFRETSRHADVLRFIDELRAVRPVFRVESMGRSALFDAQSDLFTVETYVTRQLGDLKGGAIGLALGGQYRREKLSYDYDPDANRDNFMFTIGNPDFGNDRNVEAVFAELQLPFTDHVNVQAALRYENYGNGVDSADPKLTLLWRPSLKLSVRASAGTSFRAPSLFQAFGTQTTLVQLIDPRVGAPQFFPVRTQPNPNGTPLQPESADVLNFGATWSPTDKLNLSLDYWSFDYSHVIVEQNPQALLNAAALGDILAQDHRAAQVIRRLRALLRRGETRVIPVDAAELVTEVVELSHAELITRGVSAK